LLHRLQEDEEKKKKRAARFGAPTDSEVRFISFSLSITSDLVADERSVVNVATREESKD